MKEQLKDTFGKSAQFTVMGEPVSVPDAAAIGVLISMEDPTKPMRTEAVTAGHFESAMWNKKYPKIQLITVAELLAGKR